MTGVNRAHVSAEGSPTVGAGEGKEKETRTFWQTNRWLRVKLNTNLVLGVENPSYWNSRGFLWSAVCEDKLMTTFYGRGPDHSTGLNRS